MHKETLRSPAARLELKNITLGYGKLELVSDINMVVGRGQVVGLIGGNGSGKSTILKAISGMLKAWQGHIIFEDKLLNGLRTNQVSQEGIAHIPTEKHLFLNMSVEENLLLGAYRTKIKRKENLERVFHLFPDLQGQKKVPAGILSGGQRQMLAVARAIMSNPKLLLMDEPSHGLAPQLIRQLLEAIKDLASEGMSALIIEQNVREILALSHKTYVLEQGKIVLEGPSQDLLGNPKIKKVYLGL